MTTEANRLSRGASGRRRFARYFKQHWELYLLLMVPVTLVFIFSYVPMYGLIMAFQEYRPGLGFLGSEWVGLKHFIRLFNLNSFPTILKNTFTLSIYSLVFSFPFPILLALCLNEIRDGLFKRSVQMATYATNFISTVVMVALMYQWFDVRIGVVSMIVRALGGTPQTIMGIPKYFRITYIASGIWQATGFGSVIYLAALTGVNPELHEAAVVDGASRLRRVWHIDLPSILPTVIISLILNAGSILNVGFEKVYLMRTQLNTQITNVLPIYIFQIGIKDQNFSFGTAVGLFNSAIALFMVAFVNAIAKRFGETSLW